MCLGLGGVDLVVSWSADYLVKYIWWMWLTCCVVVLYCVGCESLGVHNID